jgi:hypothetical protein
MVTLIIRDFISIIRENKRGWCASVGKVIGLDEVPGALELARRSDGPPRIVVHPHGDIS